MAVLLALVASLLAVLGTPGAASAAGCDDSWTGAAGDGLWQTAANWNNGLPTASSNVCIGNITGGAYTVTLRGSASVNSLTLGGTGGSQTLSIQGSATGNGQLSLASASSIGVNGHLLLDTTNASAYSLLDGAGVLSNAGSLKLAQGSGSTRYLRVSVVNTGTVEVEAPDSRYDVPATITNQGAFTVDATGALNMLAGVFDNQSGTVANAGVLKVAATWHQGGGAATGNPVVLQGGIWDGVGAGAGSFQLVSTNTITGTIAAAQTVTVLGSAAGSADAHLPADLTNNGQLVMDSNNSGAFSLLDGAGVLTNSGTLKLAQGSGNTRYLRVSVVNTGTTLVQSDTALYDVANTITNQGAFTVDAAGVLNVTAGVFDNQSGTVANAGVLKVAATWHQGGGAATGNPVVLSGGTWDGVGAGAGSFQLIGSNTITGTIAAAQTVTILGSTAGSANANLPANLTNNGQLVMDSTNGSAYSLLGGSGVLTNAGTLKLAQGSGNNRYLRVSVINSGTTQIESDTAVVDQANTFTNQGTVTVAAAGYLNLSSGSAVFDNVSGTVTTSGHLRVGGTWRQGGGAASGNPVELLGGTWDGVGAGAGTFQLIGSNNITGTIAAAQTVTILGSSAGSASAHLPANLTNNGQLTLDSNNGSAYSLLDGVGGLTNAGTLKLAQGSGNNRYLRVPVVNTGTTEIESASAIADAGQLLSNQGTWIVGPSGHLTGSATFTQTAAGSLQVTVNNTLGAFSRLDASTLNLDGHLEVATVGSPPIGSSYQVLTGTRTGTFSSLGYGTWAYSLNYLANGVAVVSAGATPTAPNIGTATPGNGAAVVKWSTPSSNGGTPITGYLVTPYIAGVAQTSVSFASTATTQTVNGLTNGTTYTFKVQAVNAHGTGPASSPSNPVTVGTPLAPGFQAAVPGNGTARVAFTAPGNNGSAITGYQVTPFIGAVAQPTQVFNNTATSQIVTGLTNGTTYTFSVQAINARGAGVASVTAPIKVGTPASPGFPNPVPSGTTSVRISWLAAANNGSPVTSYTVTPYIGSTAQTPIVFNSTATLQTINGLTNGTTYTFKVYATNAVGQGTSSTSAAVTVGAPAPPGYQTAAPGDGTAKVQYAIPPNNGSPITGYVVTPVIGSTPQPAQTFNTPGASQLTVTGLTNGTTYSFRIQAVNAIGSSPNAVTQTVVVGSPTTPAFPSAQPGNGNAKVSFLASSPNGSAVTGYTVTPYIGGTAQPTQTFPASSTSVTVTGLTNGTTYTFRVAATNARGASPAGVTPLAIKIGTPTTPGFPAAQSGNASAKVTWNASTPNVGVITGYAVTPVLGTTALPTQTFNSTATTQTVTGLVNGQTYTFRVAGINATGTGPYSTTAAVKVGQPAAPTAVNATAGVGQATVSWTAGADNGSPITGYVVTPIKAGVAQPTVTFNSTATTQIVTGLTAGSSYTFKVAAINANGTGLLSSASNAVVPT